MTILYFSATGNGMYLAKKIGGTLISIPKAIKENNFSFSDDKIGIIFPIYGIAVPPYISDFLQKVQLNSNYIFAIMSYGSFAGGPTSHLLQLATDNGIRFSYINTIKMIDNYLPKYEMEKQLDDAPKKQIEQHLSTIIGDVNNGKIWIYKDGFINKVLTTQMMKSNRFGTGVGVTDKYNVEDSCIKCGICAKVCPTDNIIAHDAKPVFDKKCISCLACTHNCPQNSIRLAGEKSRMRFRNQNVSLKEIIESNS